MQSKLSGVFLALAVAVFSAPLAAEKRSAPSAAGALDPAFAQHGIAFEANRGQADPGVQFVVRGLGTAVLLKPSEALIAVSDRAQAATPGVRGSDRPQRSDANRAAVRMKIVGANPSAQAHASDPLPVHTHYVGGQEAARWAAEVPSFGQVRYEQVYPGIDLVYHALDGQLEYDFIVAPGVDPRTIELAFEGAEAINVGRDGGLVLRTAAGDIRKARPVIYQQDGDERRIVDGRYVVAGDGRVAFAVGTHDPTLPLVIDPVIAYSTFWGGTGNDSARRVAVDIQGNVYIVGSTDSGDFPATAGAAQRTLGGATDVFVTKFSPTGAVIYSTYIGGPCDDWPGGIAVDAGGNAYITGRNDRCWGVDSWGAFVVKLGPNGAGVYYKLLAASQQDDSWGQAIAVDRGGNAYVTGVTSSPSGDFPTTPRAYRPTPCSHGEFLSGYDGFVTKLDPSGTGLVYSTYLCGTMNDSPNTIRVDAAGSAYVAGSTESHDFPLVNALQTQHKGSLLVPTGFVTKLKPDGSGLGYSTYLGGSAGDHINDITVDGAGNAYVTGATASGDFPVTPGVVQPKAGWPICALGACFDAFVTKISPTGTALVYSTYIAADDDDIGYGIAVDGGGNAYVAGSTWSNYFPIVDAFQSANRGTQDGFVVKLNPTGTRFVYSSYLGGSQGTTESLEGQDAIVGLALDGNGNVYVTGDTLSRDFPVAANAVQRNLAGGACDYFGSPCNDAFMTKITAGGPGVVPKINVAVTPTDIATGGTITASWSGIPTPTAYDQLNLYMLGGWSDSTYRVASWATTGTAAGTLQLAVPATVPPGWYELRLLSPDPTKFGTLGVIARSAPINIGPHPDVAVTALTNPPAVVAIGSSFAVTDATTNRGDLASASSVTRFYLSVDRVRNAGDRLLPGTRTVGVLAPGTASTGTTSVTIPTTTPLGMYVLLACADDTSVNIESNEGNNCIASAATVTVAAPDLVASAVANPPATARVGTSFTASDTTANRGGVASPASVTRYYLSADRVKSTDDRLLGGSRTVPALAPTGASSGIAMVTIPTTTPIGSYFLIACVDDTQAAIESSEINNCLASATAVTVAP